MKNNDLFFVFPFASFVWCDQTDTVAGKEPFEGIVDLIGRNKGQLAQEHCFKWHGEWQE